MSATDFFAAARRIDGGALLSFGGVYGNWHSLRALARAEPQIPAAAAVCAGDLAAYCADGAAVCATMRKQWTAAAIVRGNCERAISENDDDCGCGFAPGSACDKLSAVWHPRAKKSIPPADKKWMGALPPRLFLRFGGRKIAVLHAAADSDNRFVFASSSTTDKRAMIDELRADAVIAGHCGIPFTQNIGGKIWHNSGALGMPANDGTPRTWYAVWTRERRGLRIAHRALLYDFGAAQQAMQNAGLPPDYRIALSTGIWPSQDVLPPREREQRGAAIAQQTHFWPDDSRTSA